MVAFTRSFWVSLHSRSVWGSRDTRSDITGVGNTKGAIFQDNLRVLAYLFKFPGENFTKKVDRILSFFPEVCKIVLIPFKPPMIVKERKLAVIPLSIKIDEFSLDAVKKRLDILLMETKRLCPWP